MERRQFGSKIFRKGILLVLIPLFFDIIFVCTLSILQQQSEVAGCVIDSQRGVVVKDDKEVRLMRKELAVLNLLLRHRGQLFSTQKLLDQLWKYDDEASEVAVRACIARLRKRLTSEGLPDLISTVYGMGYTIKP
ncbi:MAG TPA: winged helix-turn-helix domain-containing protein [Trichormus sp.]|jgi:DNA-binding response OmpR family regulator